MKPWPTVRRGEVLTPTARGEPVDALKCLQAETAATTMLIQFRNGYATKAPEMLVEFRGLRRYGKGRNAYYAIRLGRIFKLTTWRV